MYKVVYKKPFIYPLLKWRFPFLTWDAGSWGHAITIANTIYTRYPLAAHILRHELCHVKQQHANKLYAYLYFIPRYFFDSKFRDRMEAEGKAAEKL